MAECGPLRGSLAGEGRTAWGEMETGLGLRGLGLSTSLVNWLNPQHNLIIIPTLQRWKLRSHKCYSGFDPPWHWALGQEMLRNPVASGQSLLDF